MIHATQLARRPQYRVRGLGDTLSPVSVTSAPWLPYLALGVAGTVLGSMLLNVVVRPRIEASGRKIRKHIRRKQKGYGIASMIVIAAASGWIGYQLAKGGVL